MEVKGGSCSAASDMQKKGRDAVGKGLDSRTAEMVKMVKVQEVWSFGLVFKSKAIEKAYRDYQKDIISTSGFLNLIGFIIGCGVFLGHLWRFKMTTEELIRGLCIHILTPSFAIYINAFHRNIFTERYDWVVTLSQLGLASLKSYATLYEAPRSDSLLHILIMWSPLSALVIIGIGYHTSFWGQFLGQFISTVASQFWTFSLCQNQCLVSKMKKVSDGLLWQLESCMSTLYLLKAGSGRRGFSCGVSMGFFHFMVGFVVPCTIKYILESHRRARFLTMRLSSSKNDAFRGLFLGNVKVALGVTVFCILFSWALVHWLLSFDELGQCPAIMS